MLDYVCIIDYNCLCLCSGYCTVCVITCVCTLCVLVYVLYVYCFRRTILLLCHKFIDRAEIPLGLLGMPRPSKKKTSLQRQENEALTDFQIVKGFQLGQHVVRAAVSPTAKHGQKTPNAARCPQWLPGRLARGPVGSKRETIYTLPLQSNMEPENDGFKSNRNLLFQGFIFRFHVSFEGCSVVSFIFLWNLSKCWCEKKRYE